MNPHLVLLAITTAAAALVGCSGAPSSSAAASNTAAAAPTAAVAKADDDAIRAALRSAGAPSDPVLIRDTPIPGLREAVVEGTVVYISSDGRYLLNGQLSDISRRRNLTADTEAELRKPQLAAVPRQERIVFPASPERQRIIVFTDVECGYCRQFHREIAQYNAQGITVEYLAFPRGGMQSSAARTTVSIWCSPDRQAALTRAKAGESIREMNCPNPVEKHYNLGVAVGVRGTPAIFDENGHMLGGYVPPQAMIAMLNQREGSETGARAVR